MERGVSCMYTRRYETLHLNTVNFGEKIFLKFHWEFLKDSLENLVIGYGDGLVQCNISYHKTNAVKLV